MNTKWECVNLLWAPYKYERQYTIYIIQHPNSRACFNTKMLSYHIGLPIIIFSPPIIKIRSMAYCKTAVTPLLTGTTAVLHGSIEMVLQLSYFCNENPMPRKMVLILKQGPGLPLVAQEFADIQLSMNKLASSNQPFPSSWPCIWRNV